MSKPVEKANQEKEMESDQIIIKEDSMKKSMPPPFSQALKGKKKAPKQVEILKVLRQVKVNIPPLDMIKQVPTYAKFLKDLCTVKRGLNIDKRAFLTEEVSSIIQCKTMVKYKDPGSPTISINIGGTCIDKALLDLVYRYTFGSGHFCPKCTGTPCSGFLILTSFRILAITCSFLIRFECFKWLNRLQGEPNII